MEIHGHRLMPGELAFLYRPDTGDFRFGNIEAATEESVTLSFEKPTWDRRDESMVVPLEQIIVAHEMNSRLPGPSYTYLANEIVLRTTSSDSAEALGVIASQEEQGHPLLVVRVVLDSNAWKVVGEPFAAKPGEVYHPLTLSALQRYRFCSPVHPLFDILRQPAGESLDLQQSGILRIRDVDIPVGVRLTIKGHEVAMDLSAHFTVSGMLASIRSEYLVDEILLPKEPTVPKWTANVAVNGTSMNSGAGVGFAGTVSVIPRSVQVVHNDGAAVATCERYIGAPMSAWTSHVWYREEQVSPLLMEMSHPPLPNAIELRCFGRSTIIHAAHKHEGVSHDYLSVVRLGPPLEDDQHAVLSTFIGYITGGRARNVLTETYAMNQKLTSTIHDRGEPTLRKQPPVPIVNTALYAGFVTRNFTTILNEFLRWRAIDSRSFDAVFHHYAEGVDSNYPVTRVLRLSIAFEAFVNLVTQDTNENEKIVGDEVFEKLRIALQEDLKRFAGRRRDEIGDEAEGRFFNKLTNLNSASNTRRMNRFWEIVPIALSESDKSLLRKLRNESVHYGFLGVANAEQDVLGDARDASRLCDILNRAILHYAKYAGPVLSAQDGRWIDAQTAETYHVPMARRGPTIEIRHNVSLPPMTEEERRAVEVLREMQREPAKSAEIFIEDEALQFPVD